MTTLPNQLPRFSGVRFCWATLLLLAAFLVHADAPIDEERAAELKVTAIGTRLAGTRQISAFSVDVRTGLDLGPDDRALAELPVLPRTISTKSLSWVHLTGYGWLLIPKGWSVVDGGVGADGSMVLIAQANANASKKANIKPDASWLEYRDAGQCVGCAISAANCFYPQAHAQAVENEFDFDSCDEANAIAGKKRTPALQYQRTNDKGGSLQTLRNYSDLDGVSYQQLRLHQPSSAKAGDSDAINLKSGALGIFFKRVWVATE